MLALIFNCDDRCYSYSQMEAYDDRCYREENEFELYWGIEEPSWKKIPPTCTKRWRAWLRDQFSATHTVLPPSALADQNETRNACVQHIINFRGLYAILVPVAVAQIVWWSITADDLVGTYISKSNVYGDSRYWIAVIMAFVACVAGATGVAGNVLLFPTVSLLLGTTTTVARDFYFVAQAVSMTSAAFPIFFLDLTVDWRVILFSGTGGIVGVVFGLESLPALEEAYAQMYIACVWFPFALTLLVSNMYHNGFVLQGISSWESDNWSHYFNWRAAVLVAAGFLGGVLSSIGGAGADMLVMAVLVLVFRVSERVVTPTVIVLTAVTSLFAALYRECAMGNVDAEVYKMLLASVPIVTLCAPVGAVAGRYLKRSVILYVLTNACGAQLLAALCVVRPWTDHNTLTPADLSTKSGVLLFASFVIFIVLMLAGQHLSAFVDLSTMRDESAFPKPVVRRRVPNSGDKARDTPREDRDEEEDSKSDDLNECGHKVTLYPAKENLTPPDREHAMVVIPYCFDESELDA